MDLGLSESHTDLRDDVMTWMTLVKKDCEDICSCCVIS